MGPAQWTGQGIDLTRCVCAWWEVSWTERNEGEVEGQVIVSDTRFP